MANTISNNRISTLISSQVPFFVRNDHPNFIAFLEAYYEYLEQNDKVINRIKNIQRYQDIDLTEDDFAEKLYSTFMVLMPKDMLADKNLLIKHIKDFYRAKGTEKSVRFLFNIIYNTTDVKFYYPKKDILRASDGKWFIQKSLRIFDTYINDVSNTSIFGLEKYIGRQISGNTSSSTAIVERIDRFYEQGTKIDELILSNIDGDFENGETVFATYSENDSTIPIRSSIFGGIVNSITITNAGTGYSIGDPVVIVSSTGNGACALVSQVSTGNIASISVLSGGAGYRANDYIFISGGGGSGANGQISDVSDDSLVHPNSYNIVSSTISLEADTPINNAVYNNLSSTNVDSWIANGMSYWSYSNTGPASTILVNTGGSGYTSTPTLDVLANTVIQSLGILGRMEIVDGGSGYQIGNKIEFINVLGGYGSGASGNVKNVNGTGVITQVEFEGVPGHFVGGAGYDINFLPTANVISGTGTNANIAVTALLGTGVDLISVSSSLGAIERIIIYSGGSNYTSNTTIDLSDSGDGTANATASIVEGLFSYPGRYLNDDGHISSYNFLEDRDYYQIFSYVIRSRVPIAKYRDILKGLTHPSGTKMFGEYMIEADVTENENAFTVPTDTDVSYAYDPVLTLNFRDTLTPDSNLTFTRTSSGTYVNATGYIATASANVARYTHNPVSLRREGVLFECSSTNLALYSEDLNNAYWSGRSNVSVSSNTVVAPDGTLTADLIVESSNNSTHYPLNKIYTGISANATYTGSLFVKKSPNRNIILQFYQGSNGAYSIINLSSGIITSNITYGGAGGTGRLDAPSKIEDYGNDWYRVSITGVGSNNSTTLGFACYMYKGSSATYQGDGVSNVAIWGVQLERRDLATSYIPTGSATVTRNSDTATVNLMSLGISTANGFTLQSEAKYYDTTGYQAAPSTISVSNTLSGAQLNYVGSRVVKGYTSPQGFVDLVAWNGTTLEVNGSDFTVKNGEKIKTAVSYQNNNVISLISNNTHKLKSTDSLVTLSNLTQVSINREASNGANGVMTIEKIKLYDRALSNSAVYQIIENP